jgi:hypothetical protein
MKEAGFPDVSEPITASTAAEAPSPPPVVVPSYFREPEVQLPGLQLPPTPTTEAGQVTVRQLNALILSTGGAELSIGLSLSNSFIRPFIEDAEKQHADLNETTRQLALALPPAEKLRDCYQQLSKDEADAACCRDALRHIDADLLSGDTGELADRRAQAQRRLALLDQRILRRRDDLHNHKQTFMHAASQLASRQRVRLFEEVQQQERDLGGIASEFAESLGKLVTLAYLRGACAAPLADDTLAQRAAEEIAPTPTPQPLPASTPPPFGPNAGPFGPLGLLPALDGYAAYRAARAAERES